MHSMTISVKKSYEIIFLNLTSRSTDDKHQDLSSVSKLKGYDADLTFKEDHVLNDDLCGFLLNALLILQYELLR